MFQKGYTPHNKGKKVTPKRAKVLRVQILKVGKSTRFKKGQKAWNKGIPSPMKGKSAIWNIGRPAWNKGKPWSKKMKEKLSIAHLRQKSWNKGKKFPEKSGKNHFAWKGSKVGYGALHDWVVRKLGKPRKCENCKTIKAKKYEWANKSGRYLRKLSDWVRLCNSCHKLNPVKMHKRFRKLI